MWRNKQWRTFWSLKVLFIIDYLPDFSLNRFFVFAVVYSAAQLVWVSQLCLSLSAALDAHRHADGLRLSIICLFCLGNCTLYALVAGCQWLPFLNAFCLLWQTSTAPKILCIHYCCLNASPHDAVTLCVNLPLMCKFRCEPPLERFSSNWHVLWRCICIPPVCFHVCVSVCSVPFVSFLPGSKSWEHNVPCLVLWQ